MKTIVLFNYTQAYKAAISIQLEKIRSQLGKYYFPVGKKSFLEKAL